MMDAESPAMPMPQYQCHKKVWALKVSEIEIYEGPKEGEENAAVFAFLHFEDKRYAPRGVSQEFFEKHVPPSDEGAGWYFVVYEDGYESMSPPEAFESGYTLIG